MRILHTSDWHLGRYLYDFSLLEDQKHMLEQVLALLREQRADALIIAGDVYDRPVPSSRAVQLYDEFLSEAVTGLGIPVLAIAGNHDSASRLEFGSGLYASSGYHIRGNPRAELSPVTLQDRHGPVDFWLIPHMHPAELRALLSDRRENIHTYDDAYRELLRHNLPRVDPARRNVAVAHGFFSPLTGSEEEKLLVTSDSEVNIGGVDIGDSACFAPFDYVALGHLHAPQRAGGDHIRYSGSPLKYSLSEERQQKSFTLLELGPKGLAECSALPVKPLRDVRTVHGSLDQLLDQGFHENQAFDDYVFAELTDMDVLYPMEKLRKLFPNLLGLRLVSQTEDAMPQIRLGGAMPRLSPDAMFRRFFREVKGYDMPPDYLAFMEETLAASGEEGSL